MLKLIRSLFQRPQRLRRVGLFREESGATAVEYAVMLGLILAGCLVAGHWDAGMKANLHVKE